MMFIVTAAETRMGSDAMATINVNKQTLLMRTGNLVRSIAALDNIIARVINRNAFRQHRLVNIVTFKLIPVAVLTCGHHCNTL